MGIQSREFECFIGETNMCKMKISNKSIFPILNIVFRFKCENKLTWNHDEINKNYSTGSNYYMNFNLKGRSQFYLICKL